jgi:F0F1-type ATP synthase assembly protein I
MKQGKKPLPLLQVGVGTFISSMTVSGFLLGYGTDYLLGTVPLFMLAFGFLGLIGGFLKAFKFLSLTDKKEIDEAGNPSHGKHAPTDDHTNRSGFDRRRGF